MYIAQMQPNGTAADKGDLFKILAAQPAEKIEQSVAEKAKICKMAYP
jgi:hypothetical protein